MIDNGPLDFSTETVEGEQRMTSIGHTDQGRFLVVITTLRGVRLRVVTAFPAHPGNWLVSTSCTKKRKSPAMTDRLKLPKFATEAEEAQWWYDHREELAQAVEAAAARGELRSGSAARLAREQAAGVTPTTTIRLDRADIARARALAAKRGLRYQTFLKMLLHEALDAEEKKRAS